MYALVALPCLDDDDRKNDAGLLLSNHSNLTTKQCQEVLKSGSYFQQMKRLVSGTDVRGRQLKCQPMCLALRDREGKTLTNESLACRLL